MYFKNKEPFTAIAVGGFAMTSCLRGFACEHPKNDERSLVFKQTTRQRKVSGLRLDEGTLLFQGHGLPLIVEGEVKRGDNGAMTCMQGDALLNVHHPEGIDAARTFIEERNLNKGFTAWDRLVFVGADDPENRTPMYPERALHSDNVHQQERTRKMFPELTAR